MGVLNVTPDSFSDGGRYIDPTVAIAAVEQMVATGADLIDVGGESTRPGSQPVPVDEQIRRVVPVLTGIRNLPVTISIDTTKAQVAEAALNAGATVVNDISSGLDDAEMIPLAVSRQCPIVLMHMKGTPLTMQRDPSYTDVVAEVSTFLVDRARVAIGAGVRPHNVLLDPGIGFGKTMVHNLQLLRDLRKLAGLGYPLLVGTSRKKFIGTLSGETEPAGRVMGTAASVAWSIANGAAIVRVHDVEAMAKVVRVVRAIMVGNP
jgi:dihydropteroate synthase